MASNQKCTLRQPLYHNASRRAVRARSSVPVIIFFDELGALALLREPSAGSEASSRVVNTSLTELDGIDKASKEGIYVIAATNRPDIIDPAMLRPGRLDTMLYVGLPTAEERSEILRTLCNRRLTSQNTAVASSVSDNQSQGHQNFRFTPELATLVQSSACEGYSGADLESLLRRSGYAAIRRDGTSLELADFQAAVAEVPRSVSKSEVKRYEELKEKRTRIK